MKKNNETKVFIKNYAYLFNLFMPLILIAVTVALYIIWKYLRILAVEGGEVNYSFYASIVALTFFVWHVLEGVKNFQKKPPIFIFNESQIIYDYYKNDYRHRRIVKKDIKDIVKVRYILHSEAPYQYGIVNKKSLIKRFFSDDIGDAFMHLIVYFLGFTSLLLNLPIKIIILFKNKEPLSLLYKNLFIEFNDGTAMIINMYKQKHYESVESFFRQNNKEVDKTTIINIYLKEEK